MFPTFISIIGLAVGVLQLHVTNAAPTPCVGLDAIENTLISTCPGDEIPDSDVSELCLKLRQMRAQMIRVCEAEQVLETTNP